MCLTSPLRAFHMADVERLIATFRSLLDQGITLVIVEHNLSMIAAADHVIEMGPGAGKTRGARSIYQGAPLK